MLNKIRKTGWRYSFAILFNRIIPKWLFRIRRYVVYQMDVDRSIAAAESQQTDSNSLTVQRCNSESQMRAIEDLTWFKREYSSGNSWAYQASLEGKLIGGFWAASDRFDEDELGVRIELSSQQAWLFAALVSGEARGQGVYSRLLPFVVADANASGFSEVLLSVNPDNLRSNSIHKRWSKATLGTVFAIRFFKIACCFCSGSIKKDRTVSFNSGSNPILLHIVSE